MSVLFMFRGKCNVNSVAPFKIISRASTAVLQYEYWQNAWSTLFFNKFMFKKLSLFGNWRIITGFTELAINLKPLKQSTVSAPSFRDPTPKLTQTFIFCYDENFIVISHLLVCVMLRPFYNSSFHYFSSIWLEDTNYVAPFYAVFPPFSCYLLPLVSIYSQYPLHLLKHPHYIFLTLGWFPNIYHP